MKKIISIYITLFLFYLLSAELVNFNHLQFPKNEHFTLVSYDQPHFTIFHKDLIVSIYANNEKEIIYENPQRITSIENTRDTILRLHFNADYPSFFILNEDHIFSHWDANWINSTTAEISVPSGIYKIYTIFLIESYKLVVRYDVDLTIGTGFHEVWIEHNEATNVLELNGCDINGEPFDMSEKYRANFMFYLFNEISLCLLFSSINNQMITSEILEDLNFVAGELKFDEDNVYITQYGPIQEINSSLLFSNEPIDYYSQQILLHIPEFNEDLKIGISNTLWSFHYVSYFAGNDLFECSEDQWSTNLYMMNRVYERCGSTTMIYLGYLEDRSWRSIYNVAPFHCIDDKIGSFWNVVPITVNYLSPDGEQLIFGQSPIYLEVYHLYLNNLLCPMIDHWGFNKEKRSFDFYNSTFILTDSNGNIIAQGELIDMWNLNISQDIYTLTIEDNNFSLAGLPGTGTLVNNFNTALELPKPPFVNSFIIFNENNEPVNRLEYNENATLLFCVADVEYIDGLSIYCPVVTDSVKVFCKLHDEENWQEFETELIDEFPELGWTFGKVFSTDLSEATTIDSVAYDLKIYFEDNEENYTEWILEPAFVVGNFDVTSISNEEIQNENLSDIKLFSNFPNPFNPETLISFNLQKANDIKLEIYNMKGQKVKTLVNKRYIAGYHSIVWDGTDNSGNPIGSGIYLYQLKAGSEFSRIKKMLLLK